jgi:hypothetical protein
LAIGTTVIREYIGHGMVGSNQHLLPALACRNIQNDCF